MRKAIWLAFFFCLLLVSGAFLYARQQRNVQFEIDEQGEVFLEVRCGEWEESIYPWYNDEEECYYFFMPSFVADERIYCDAIESGSVFVNDQPLKRGRTFLWREGERYEFASSGGEWQVQFMRSANLPAIFLTTDNGGMTYLNEDKTHETSGEIRVVDHTGNVQYAGGIARIWGRGNYTWTNVPKKSYNIRLEEAEALCGLRKGKRFCLLAIFREGSKMNSMIAYQLAQQLSMEYAVGAEWVDVWFDGRYAGLYLLAESVSVGDGRIEITDLDKNRSGQTDENGVFLSFEEEDKKGYMTDCPSDISGGYLIEKELSSRYGDEGAGFILNSGYHFLLKEPQYASYDEVSYIQSCFERVEDSIMSGVPDFEHLIDLDSFVERFLVEELTLNYDAGKTSTFFYKQQGDDLLYAGPVWDYDIAFGEWEWTDYTDSILNQQHTEVLDWYDYLYKDEQFYQRMREKYQSVLPWFEWLLTEGIDEYAQYIGASERMDAVMWGRKYPLGDKPGIYQLFENNVRYLKYFIANRLNYLNERWQVDEEPFELPGNGEYHLVTFSIDGWVEDEQYILDGMTIVEQPELNKDLYENWIFEYSGQCYQSTIPILEDTQFTIDEEYRLARLQEKESVSEYFSLLEDDVFSCCIYIPNDSLIYQNPELAAMIKNLARDEKPQYIQEAQDTKNSYFIIVDNGWQKVWESIGDEPVEEVGTTFGAVSYGKDEFGDFFLYIQGDGNNYLLQREEDDIVIVVINRRLGRIEDVRGFRMSGEE